MTDKVMARIKEIMEKEFPGMLYFMQVNDLKTTEMRFFGNHCIVCVNEAVADFIDENNISHDSHEEDVTIQ